jgi:hypothetical protein
MKRISLLIFLFFLSIRLFSQNVGIGTLAPLTKLHIKGGLLLDSTNGVTPMSGDGTRLMWIPSKAAFRAGKVTLGIWDDANIGLNSVATGNSTAASGFNSTAWGSFTVASGDYSTAMGFNTIASGYNSTATGTDTRASGILAMSMGNNTLASGNYSSVMGTNTNSKSYAGLVIGSYNDTANAANPASFNGLNRVFQIGNGTADNARSNAMTVLQNGNVGMGTISPLTKLHLSSTASNIATFSGGSQMWITLAEGTSNRGYIGSYAGNPEDVDFGTYGDNLTGKVHLTTSNLPRLTVTPLGAVGIGTTLPLQQLDIAGAVKIGNTSTNAAGSIRFNNANNDFEGFDGSQWKSLTASNAPPPQTEQNDDPNSNAGDNLGGAVKAVLGNLSNVFIFVGAPKYKVGANINQGIVKVYRKNVFTNKFDLFQTITAIDGAAGDKFGFSLDATFRTGDCNVDNHYSTFYLVVGAPYKNANRGGIYLYRFDYALDQFIAVVNNFSASDGAANDNYGYAVSLLNNARRVLVGAPSKTVNGLVNNGRAYVVNLQAPTDTVGCTNSHIYGLSELGILNMSSNAANSYFGSSLAIDYYITGGLGRYLYAVGASFKTVNGNLNQGMVYMFRDLTTYDSIVVAPDGNAQDYFGNALCFQRSTGILSVAAYGKDNGAITNQGAVYIFKDTTNFAGTRWWQQVSKFYAPDGVANDLFGSSLSWSGTLLVGASNRDDGATDAGAVYMFEPIPYGNGQLRYKAKITDVNPQPLSQLGKSISHTENNYVFGLPDWDAPGKPGTGKIIIGDIFH